MLSQVVAHLQFSQNQLQEANSWNLRQENPTSAGGIIIEQQMIHSTYKRCPSTGSTRAQDYTCPQFVEAKVWWFGRKTTRNTAVLGVPGKNVRLPSCFGDFVEIRSNPMQTSWLNPSDFFFPFGSPSLRVPIHEPFPGIYR